MSNKVANALLVVAREADFYHVREDAGPNQDRAGRIAMYLAVCGIHSPAPWCAALVTWTLLQVGYKLEELPSHPASTYYWWTWAKTNNRLKWIWADAKRGDLFIWNVAGAGGQRVGHVGFILEPARKVLGIYWIRTIEGNSNDQGGREGVALVRRGIQGASGIFGWRRVTSRMRFIVL